MEVQVRILGIDPGLHLCGYACIEVDGNTENLIEAGVIRIRTGLPLPAKLNQIAEDIQTILDKFMPQVVAVEELYSHYAHPRTAILMGHARGVILQKMAAAGVRGEEFQRHADQEIADRQRPSLQRAGPANDPDAPRPAAVARAAGRRRRHRRRPVLRDDHDAYH